MSATDLALLLLVVTLAVASADRPRVRLSDGELLGTTETSAAGTPYPAFYGIPYAQPPVGALRFRRPEPVQPWNGTRDAGSPSEPCTQLYVDRFRGSEDCLYANVYTPSLPEDPPSAPGRHVVVYIPGGAFNFGSGGPGQLGGGRFVDEGIILVTFNYRVGPFGFLTTEDEAAPGNYGLHDQVLALRWVRDNIAAFGGDPDRVTLAGESAGGASVHLHMLSPLSRGLFQRAISQSATALSFWALGEGQRTKAEQVGAALGCPVNRSAELVDCLREASAQSIVATLEPAFRRWSIYPMVFAFRPRVERGVPGAFLPDSPRRLLERGEVADVPWLVGFNSDEGGTFGSFSLLNASALESLRRNPDTNGPVWLGLETQRNTSALYEAIRQFYFGTQRPGLTTAAQFIQAEGDRYFASGVDVAVRLQARHSTAPVFKYVLEEVPETSFPALLAQKAGNSELPFFPWGVSHKDDLRYLFTGPRFPASRRDGEFATKLTSVWSGFIRTGRPQSALLNVSAWKPYKERQDNHMRLSSSPRPDTGAYQKRMEFWRSLPIDEDWNPTKQAE
ncbi:esterase FE4-like [Amphibalanus amphitrite]|uniref:esterase FE4-like n=1 Tax=Amphibalanus amphitrite TaxID=1232801 RepID=UPI001C8FCE58|nr:esterase FE4-like [Amphibalanus amphitrite]